MHGENLKLEYIFFVVYPSLTPC